MSLEQGEPDLPNMLHGELRGGRAEYRRRVRKEDREAPWMRRQIADQRARNHALARLRDENRSRFEALLLEEKAKEPDLSTATEGAK